MLRHLVGAVAALVAVPTIAASAPGAHAAEDASAGCVRDVSTPTAVATRPRTGPSDARVLLTPEAAVIAPDDEAQEPIVVGGPDGLPEALRGTRAWAASPLGLVVSTVETGSSDDPGEPDEVVRRVREILSDGRPVGIGRLLTGVRTVASWGPYVLIRLPGSYTTLRPAPSDFRSPRGLRITTDIDSVVGLIPAADQGGVTATDGARMELDEVVDRGASGDLSIGGVGHDRILIHEATDDGSRYWTWVPAEDRLTPVATTGPLGNGNAAVCGDLLYVVDDHELRVIDTTVSPGTGAIVSRRPVSPEDVPYGIDAVPGGLALKEYRDGDLQVTWFHTS